MFKKIISLFLVFAMLTSVGTSVFAKDIENAENIIHINGVELTNDTHVVTIADLYHALDKDVVAAYSNEISPVDGHYTLTSSKLIEMFSLSVYGDKDTIWNDIRGSKADVSIRNGVIALHTNRRTDLRNRTFIVTDSQKVGYVGYHANFVLTTKFAFTDTPVMFKVTSATKQAIKDTNWLVPAYTTDLFEIDPPSSASTGARWSFTLNSNGDSYSLETYSYQE